MSEQIISIKNIKEGVMSIPLGKPLDEVVAKEVYGLVDTGVIHQVVNPVDGQPAGESTWTTKDGVAVRLPMFSTVPFIGCLMLEDLRKETQIIRTAEGQYQVTFTGEEGSGITIEGESFAEAVTRAAVFEHRFKVTFEKVVAEAFSEPDEPIAD